MLAFWFAVIILFVLIEMGTSGLWAVYCAIGGIGALIALMLGQSLWVQICVFVCVSALLWFGTRPFIRKLPEDAPSRRRIRKKEKIQSK